MTDKNKVVSPAPAGAVANAVYALRACTGAALFGEQPSRDQAEKWVVDILCVCAAMTLTDDQRTKAVTVIRELPSGQATIEAFVRACEDEPSLAELGAALKARVSETSSFISCPADNFEIDLKCVVDSSFESGNGVLTFGASTPDEVIVVAIRTALAAGKPFRVIPA